MNKKAEANVRTLILSILFFSLILSSGLHLGSYLISSKGVEESTDFDTLNALVNEHKNLTDDMEDSLNKGNRTFAEKIGTGIEGVLFDSWFGIIVKPITLIWDNINLVSQYIGTLGGVLNLENSDLDWIVPTIRTILVIGILTLVVYFIRSGK